MSYFSHSLCHGLACQTDAISIDRMVDEKKTDFLSISRLKGVMVLAVLVSLRRNTRKYEV